MTPAEARWFRCVMRLYPAAFRAAYANEMRVVLADQLRDARQQGGAAVAGVWVTTIVDALVTAPGEYVRNEQTVPQTVDPVRASKGRTSTTRGWVAIAAVPLILYGVLMVAAPGFMDPFFSNPPSIAGLPAGIVVLSVALGLTALGLLIVATARTDVTRLLAIALLAMPAVALILFGPAAILIIQNLAV